MFKCDIILTEQNRTEQNRTEQNRTEQNFRRLFFLDVLKAIAIVAVVFYHAGFQKYGYLGVDIFLPISGFLTTQSILSEYDQNRFSYFKFLKRRILRLWPLILLASFVSLIIGYFSMLPDDYENLAESIVASNVFANNILACITTKNYWNIVNDYKPLMQMWYLGVLMQCLLLLPVIFMLANRIGGGKHDLRSHSCYAFIIIGIISFTLCLAPVFSSAQRFYYFPFRLFEVLLGAIVACLVPQIKSTKLIKNENIATEGMFFCCCLTVFLLLFPIRFVPDFSRLVGICILATLSIVFSLRVENESLNGSLKFISVIGRCTLSIFVWHQVILAFTRYTMKSMFPFLDMVLYLCALSVIVALSWRYVERFFSNACGTKKGENVALAFCIILFIVTSGVSLYLYFNAGVVRNVPELDININNIHRNMHAEYCDRGYAFDKDFTNAKNKKILVIGDSFGRDWINILLESDIADNVEISYIFPHSEAYVKKRISRLKEADYIFYALSNNDFTTLPEYLEDIFSTGNVYIIGNKNFGENNGQIYARRNRDDYFESTVKLADEYYRQNNMLKEKYGDHYIDMIGVVQVDDGSVRVFSDKHKFISQDCAHLTQGGAIYYASLIYLDWIIL